jgi:hypothetical protein
VRYSAPVQTGPWAHPASYTVGRLRLKCDGTRAETRFRYSAKRTSPFKSAGALVQSTTGSRGVRISGSNAGYAMFRGNVKCTGYSLHSPVSPSPPLHCVSVCHHISIGLYRFSFPGVKWLGRRVDHPPPSSAEVQARVKLYSPSAPSWSSSRLNFTFTRKGSCKTSG